MKWLTKETEYEGLPLLLRRPDYDDIWRYKETLTQLVSVHHLLDKATSNGLPEKHYNQTLATFDHYMCSLFDESPEGLIFLIETFGGKRNYYYYTLQHYDISKLMDQAKINFNVKLTITVKEDYEWGFLKAYPIKLFKP